MFSSRRILASTGIAAMSLSLLALPANAEPDAKADVDGDNRPDSVSLRQISDHEMLLRIAVRDQFVDTRVAGNGGGQPVRQVDVNEDGRDEVMVPVSVGANTITYAVWGYENGLYEIRTEQGDPFRLAEGGGATAVSTYGCQQVPTGRDLVTVNAYEAASGNYKGERVRYSVFDGVASVESETVLRDVPREDPALRADPGTCAA